MHRKNTDIIIKFILVGIMVLGSNLATTPVRAQEEKATVTKRKTRIFRPMVPIKRNVSDAASVETGKITITPPALIPPPPIPVTSGLTEIETEELEPSDLEPTDTTTASGEEQVVSKSDTPPSEKPELPSPEKSIKSTPPEPKKKKTSNFKAPATIAEISGPPTLENLRASAHVLAKEGLTYKFGYDNPKQGGMDCSGALQFLLTRLGIKNVPRTSYDQYDWLKNKKTLDDVYGSKASSKIFKKLSPGDLIFWGNTWNSGHRVSHVMMYMGYDPKVKKHYAFGARSSKKGLLGNGVDIFDLDLNQGRLIAHGKIPGLVY